MSLARVLACFCTLYLLKEAIVGDADEEESDESTPGKIIDQSITHHLTRMMWGILSLAP